MPGFSDSLTLAPMETQRPYIAIVDDDQSVGKALSRLLRTANLEAAAFTSGADFLQSLPGRRPDCLVLDIQMPGMDGIQLRDRLSSLGYAIPIVFVTAQDDRTARQSAMDGGAAAFLQKPLNDEDLQKAIDGITKSGDPEPGTGEGTDKIHHLEEVRGRSSEPHSRRKADGSRIRQVLAQVNRLVKEQQELRREKTRLESALDKMGNRLIDSIEQERGRIARELHDDLCQRLALLAIGLEQLAQTEDLPQTEIGSQIRLLWKDTADICSDAGRLSRELHSCKLEQLGLVPAVRSLCADLSKRHGIAIEFGSRGIPQAVPGESALCLFRIAQGALGNVVTHSKAHAARVELHWDSENLRLRIRDNGVGFDPASVGGKGRLGLISMRERARIVGGKISIRSRLSHGTAIEVRIPYTLDSQLRPDTPQ